MSLNGKTLFITGASRGIGLAIAVRAARDGANIAVAAKTKEPHPKLPGTIFTAAEAIEAAGGKALPLVMDVRDGSAVEAAVAAAAERFGGIDICINNASAIQLTGVEETEMKRFDLMHQINTRGTYLTTKACLPYLKAAANPHVLVISPPLDLAPKWFGPHVAYSIAKYGMSLCVLGMAEEFGKWGIGVNALWPHTPIATAAIEFATRSRSEFENCRKPEIMADAAYAVLTKPAREFTGHFLIDDLLLAGEGVTDFERYKYSADGTLTMDLFVDEKTPIPPGITITPARFGRDPTMSPAGAEAAEPERDAWPGR